jgi:hypothetical protein
VKRKAALEGKSEACAGVGRGGDEEMGRRCGAEDGGDTRLRARCLPYQDGGRDFGDGCNPEESSSV